MVLPLAVLEMARFTVPGPALYDADSFNQSSYVLFAALNKQGQLVLTLLDHTVRLPMNQGLNKSSCSSWHNLP